MSKLFLFFALIVVALSKPTEEVSLEKTPIEIITCLFGHEELVKDVKDIIAMIKSQDYSQLLTLVMKLYTDGSAAVKECILSEVNTSNKESKCRFRCPYRASGGELMCGIVCA